MNKHINNEGNVIYRIPMTHEKNNVMKIFWPPFSCAIARTCADVWPLCSLGATISGMRHRCRLRHETGWAESPDIRLFQNGCSQSSRFPTVDQGERRLWERDYIGDLNCDIINPLHNNQQGKCLLDICEIYDLDSLITSPTRIFTNRASCLDVILTNVPAFIKDSGVIETGLSDHCLVHAVLNTTLKKLQGDPLKTSTRKPSFVTSTQCLFRSRTLLTIPTMFIGAGNNFTLKY